MSKLALSLALALALLPGCKKKEAAPAATGAPASAETAAPKGPTAAQTTDPNNIVGIAVGSPDHKTLVAALQAADYVAAVSNPGPLTVFAPTDAAFAKLPAGTVEELVKPENADKLKNILKYHATTSVWDDKTLTDGMILAMANGKKVTVKVDAAGKIKINDANVVASVRATNGIVHVIDGVLLPPPE